VTFLIIDNIDLKIPSTLLQIIHLGVLSEG
jgi:hypothetical protein